jgi:anti-sigma-K factor RskA
VLWDDHRDRWVLFASGLHRAAEGSSYRLWAVGEDQRTVSLGSFDPDAHGLATFDAELPAGDIAWASAMVTEEPIGESSAPTGPILLAGAVR